VEDRVQHFWKEALRSEVMFRSQRVLEYAYGLIVPEGSNQGFERSSAHVGEIKISSYEKS